MVGWGVEFDGWKCVGLGMMVGESRRGVERGVYGSLERGGEGQNSAGRFCCVGDFA